MTTENTNAMPEAAPVGDVTRIAPPGADDQAMIAPNPQYSGPDHVDADHDPLHGDKVALSNAEPVDFHGIVYGGDGADQFDLSRLSGDRSLTGGEGDDTFIAGSGNDTFIYSSVNDGHDTIRNFVVGEDRIDLDALFAAFGAEGIEPEDISYTVEHGDWDAHDYTIKVSGGEKTVEIDVLHSNTTDIELFKTALSTDPDSQMGS